MLAVLCEVLVFVHLFFTYCFVFGVAVCCLRFLFDCALHCLLRQLILDKDLCCYSLVACFGLVG